MCAYISADADDFYLYSNPDLGLENAARSTSSVQNVVPLPIDAARNGKRPELLGHSGLARVVLATPSPKNPTDLL